MSQRALRGHGNGNPRKPRRLRTPGTLESLDMETGNRKVSSSQKLLEVRKTLKQRKAETKRRKRKVKDRKDVGNSNDLGDRKDPEVVVLDPPRDSKNPKQYVSHISLQKSYISRIGLPCNSSRGY